VALFPHCPVVPAGPVPALHLIHGRAGGGPVRAVRRELRRAVRHRSLPCEDRCRTARAAAIRAPRTGADPGRAGPVVDAAAIRRDRFHGSFAWARQDPHHRLV